MLLVVPLLDRSRDWPTYRTTLIGSYESPADIVLVLNLMQQQWDRTEPTGFADGILTGQIRGVPQKQVFMQIAIADDEVSNVASEYQARTMGIPIFHGRIDKTLFITSLRTLSKRTQERAA